MSDNIKFSIIIPTYNRDYLIADTIRGFLSQTYQSFEVIVVDDGGSDNTEAIVTEFKDSRLKYFWKKNEERGAARNFGAVRAIGDYINFFDSDDVVFPNHLEEAYRAIRDLKSPMVFHLGMEMRDENGRQVFEIKNTANRKKIFSCSYVNPNPVFIKKEAFLSVQFHQERDLSGTEDWLFHLQLASRYAFIPYDGVVTSSMRQHSNRSMELTTASEIRRRGTLLAKHLSADSYFMEGHSQWLDKIKAEMISLTSLYYSIEGKKRSCLRYFALALSLKPGLLFTRRTLAIIKYLLKSN